MVQHIDIVPTILDLVKAPAPGNLRGRSLKPLLDGTGRIRAQPVYSEALYSRYHFGWSGLTAVTGERYQYIKAPREELYDLTRDRRERENVAEERVEARRAMSADLNRFDSGREVGTPDPFSVDPKDKPEVLETYRSAIELAGDRKWSEAIGLLRRVLHDDPDVPEVWDQLAAVAFVSNRYDVALDAYRHSIELKPSEPSAYLGAAEVLLKQRKLEDARARASAAADAASDKDTRSRASAHELLARIALARHDSDLAREEAGLAHQANPSLPVPAFVDARILYDQGKYDEALALFEQAVAEGKKAGAAPMPDLHFYTGDTLERLDRRSEAEAEFTEEIRYFPQNVRARAALATIYHTTGQSDAADSAITDMLRASPTPDSYTLAARLWKSFGKTRQAEAIRAEARRTFAAPRR